MDARLLLRIAWMSIALGVGMQAIILVLLYAGDRFRAANFAADALSFVSWSIVACTGLAIGGALARLRVGLIGLAGAIAAPLAFGVARTVHVGVSTALEATTAPGLPPTLVALVKTIEYALLGIGLAVVAERWPEDTKKMLGVGATVGIVFGGAIVAWVAIALAPPAPVLAARAVNEVLFPMGCTLVLATARVLRQPNEAVELAGASAAS